MKAAVLGTSDYHVTMQQIVKNVLQRHAGYTPQIADGQIDIPLPPMDANAIQYADTVAKALADDDTIMMGNPRSPYLFLAWLLIGWDNIHRLNQYIDDDRLQRRIAFEFIRLALGQPPQTHNFHEYAIATTQWNENQYIAACFSDIVGELSTNPFRKRQPDVPKVTRSAMKNVTKYVAGNIRMFPEKYRIVPGHAHGSFAQLCQTLHDYFIVRLRQWLNCSDDELLPVIRRLLLDVLGKVE